MELSDIIDFAELPDGKVLTGTEYGNLLLWEGNLIKCLFFKQGSLGAEKCHEGQIDVVFLKNEHFITAGNDGFIRWWDFNAIDLAEPEEGLDYILTCSQEVQILSRGVPT